MVEKIKSVSALDIIFLFRIKGEESNAWKLALQTDNSTDESREYESTPTKDGTEKTAGAYEGSHSITALLANSEDGRSRIREIKRLVREDNPQPLEIWEIDRSDIKDSTELYGEYSEDYVTSVGTSAGAEGSVEVSIETEVNGTIQEGKVDVTPELLAILQKITEDQDFVQPIVDGGDVGGA